MLNMQSFENEWTPSAVTTERRWTFACCRWGIYLLTAAAISAALPLAAHDSPEHVVEQLTTRIKVLGEKPELLWRRAIEYRALGRLDAAARDLRQALKMDPSFLPALTDLSRIHLAQRKTKAALENINRALALVADEAGRAPLLMIRADAYASDGRLEKALADCDAALQAAPGADAEWYLTRSQIQSRLGKFADAVAGLKQAIALTGNGALEAECVEAMIEAGQFREALEHIEPQLAESRWQSSWLLRRARVRLAQGLTSGAHADLLAAIEELNQRLNGVQPESSILVDRGIAYALLGDASFARRDLTAARKRGADAEALRRLERTLAAAR